MIKNAPRGSLGVFLLLAVSLPCCGGSARREAEERAFQGVVEFEETTLAFEVGGRVQSRVVSEGDHVESGTVLADLDDELLKSALAARTAEVASALAEVDRVRSGSRREDIDAMAIGFMRTLQSEGISIGKDVSVVGFDDIPASAMYWPGLTTVRQEMRSMGAAACRSLMASVEGEELSTKPAEFGMKLVVRQSTGPAPSK